MNRDNCRRVLAQVSKHCVVMSHYANGGGVEYYSLLNGGCWTDTSRPAFTDGTSYRIKKNTVTINGIECVAGEVTKPKYAELYYIPILHTVSAKKSTITYRWCDDHYDKERLRLGLVFSEKSDAIAINEALLSAIKPKKG